MTNKIEAQTDYIEAVIDELNQLNALTYKGYSIETSSSMLHQDNVDDICACLKNLSMTADKNIKVIVVTC